MRRFTTRGFSVIGEQIGIIPPYGEYPDHPKNGENERIVIQKQGGGFATMVTKFTVIEEIPNV